MQTLGVLNPLRHRRVFKEIQKSASSSEELAFRRHLKNYAYVYMEMLSFEKIVQIAGSGATDNDNNISPIWNFHPKNPYFLLLGGKDGIVLLAELALIAACFDLCRAKQCRLTWHSRPFMNMKGFYFGRRKPLIRKSGVWRTSVFRTSKSAGQP